MHGTAAAREPDANEAAAAAAPRKRRNTNAGGGGRRPSRTRNQAAALETNPAGVAAAVRGGRGYTYSHPQKDFGGANAQPKRRMLHHLSPQQCIITRQRRGCHVGKENVISR